MKICVLIPCYDHGSTIRRVVEALAPAELPCLIVDDGSHEATRTELESVARDHPWVQVHRREHNGGRGVAVQTGLRIAWNRGFTHLVHLDADAQHDPADVPRFVAAMRQDPNALVVGNPIFDASAPRSRIFARQFSRGLVWLSTLSLEIRDPLCGYRAMPLATALSVIDNVRVGSQMDFDPDLAVRMFWAGAPIANVSTRVVYPEGGLSHFRNVLDTLRMAWLYVRLLAGMLWRSPRLLRRALARSPGAARTSRENWRNWSEVAERGSLVGLRFVTRLYRAVGRRACLPIVYAAAAYFFVRNRTARRVSREYLQTLYATPLGRQALGHPPTNRDVYRHIFEFAMNIFDRLVVFGGGSDLMSFSHSGSELLFELAQEKRGAILLGSHVGSFDMLRTVAAAHGLKVNVLMFTGNAARINSFFERLDPGSSVQVLAFEPGSIRTAFEIRACIERGEFVGILADRLAPGGREKHAFVPFLGKPAPFPLGAFLLASVLGCPLLVSMSLRTGNATYDLMTKPLDMKPGAPHRDRDKRARELCAAYVRVLEEYCVRAPHQWMNFYEFWNAPINGEPETAEPT